MGDLIAVDFKNKKNLGKLRTESEELQEELTELALKVLKLLPTCHDDLEGANVLEYETSLGYWPKEPA